MDQPINKHAMFHKQTAGKQYNIKITQAGNSNTLQYTMQSNNIKVLKND